MNKLLLFLSIFLIGLSVNAQKRGVYNYTLNGYKSPKHVSSFSNLTETKPVEEKAFSVNTNGLVSSKKRAVLTIVDTSTYFSSKRFYASPKTGATTLVTYPSAAGDSTEFSTAYQIIPNNSQITMKGVRMQMVSLNKGAKKANVDVKVYSLTDGSTLATSRKEIAYSATAYGLYDFIFDKPLVTNSDILVAIEPASETDSVQFPNSGGYRNASITCNITGNQLTLATPAPTTNLGTSFWVGQEITGNGIAAGTKIIDVKTVTAATSTTPAVFSYTLSRAVTTTLTNVVITGVNLTFDDQKNKAGFIYYKYPTVAGSKTKPDFTKAPKESPDALIWLNLGTSTAPSWKAHDGNITMFPIVEYVFESTPNVDNKCLGDKNEVNITYTNTNAFNIAKNPLLNKMAFWTKYLGYSKKNNYYFSRVISSGNASFSDTIDLATTPASGTTTFGYKKFTYTATDKNDTLKVYDLILPWGYMVSPGTKGFSSNYLLSSKINVTTTSSNATFSKADGKATVTVTGGYSPHTYLWSNSQTTSEVNVPKGDYSVNVTDANGCKGIAKVNVGEFPQGGFMKTSIDTSGFFNFKRAYASPVTSSKVLVPYYNSNKDTITMSSVFQIIPNLNKSKVTYKGITIPLVSSNKQVGFANVDVKVLDSNGVNIIAKATQKVLYNATSYGIYHFMFDKPVTTSENLIISIEPQTPNDSLRVPTSGAYRNSSITCNISGNKLTLVSPAPTSPVNIGTGFWTGQEITGSGIPAGTKIISSTIVTPASGTTPAIYSYTLSNTLTSELTNVVVSGINLTFDDLKDQAGVIYNSFPVIAGTKNPDIGKQPVQQVERLHWINSGTSTAPNWKSYDGNISMYPIVEYTYNVNLDIDNKCLGDNKEVNITYPESEGFASISKNPVLSKMAFWSKYLGLNKKNGYYYSIASTKSGSYKDTLDNTNQTFFHNYKASSDIKNDTLVVNNFILPYGYYKAATVISNTSTFMLSSKMNLTTSAIQSTPGQSDGRASVNVTGGLVPYSYLWSNNQTTAQISVPKGDYSVNVTDANGCKILGKVNVTELFLAPNTSTTYITSCNSYQWNGNKYSASGNYSFNTKTVKGNDSIAMLILTINNSTYSSMQKSTCGSYEWNGKIYTQSGKYEFITKNVNGCDSIATLYLTVNKPSTSSITHSTCGSYTWNGKIYSQSGKYDYILKAANGCDSIITLNLTILSPSTSTSLFTSTGSYTWNGVNYTQSGLYTYKTKNANGCDSVATLLLTVNAPGTSTTIINSCYSYSWNGSTYKQSGAYTYKTKNSKGNDSIATLLLTINDTVKTTITRTACQNYTWNGKTYTQSGKYDFISKSSKGCDSIVSLFLTINSPKNTVISETQCGSYSWNGKTYTQSGKYDYILKAANGCDSIVTLNLTILSPTSSTTIYTTTGSYTWNGINYTQSGLYTYKTKNAKGCDSVATLLLTINAPSTSTTIFTSCDNYSWNGSTYNQTGTYIFKTKTPKGVDSTATLLLTINKPSFSIINEMVCGSYTWNGKTYTQSGKYDFKTKNAKGCDSIVTLNLTISSPTSSTSKYTANASYTWNGENYNQSGIYTFKTKNIYGCDSVATLMLTIIAPGKSTTTINACDNYSWNGNTYNQTGTYVFKTKTAKGTDSTATLLLTINQKTTSSVIEKACGSYTWNGKTYNQSGKYEFVTKNVKGCDSIVTLDLTINAKPNLGIEKLNSTLISSQSNGLYQWFNCDSLSLVLPNSTDQKYIPTKTGNYAVKINLNGCTETTSCIKFESSSTMGIDTKEENQFSIYPNPNNGIFSVTGLNTGSYKIFDVLGTEVYSFKIQTNEILQLDLSHLAKGVYHFATDDAHKLNGKVIITD